MELTDKQFRELKKRLTTAESIDDLVGRNGVIRELLGNAINSLLESELDSHLGYPPYAVTGHHSGNSRNGSTTKTVQSSFGPIELKIPRDRAGSFSPRIVPKHKRVLEEIEEKVIALYARGMSTRDISAQLEDIYGATISATTISEITDRILPQLTEWQNRELEPVYVIVYLDAIHYRVRHEGRVQIMGVYTCLGVTLTGQKQLLGLWVAEQEGARYWQSVLTDLSNRGVKDIFIACVDGLTGFPEAIHSIFPRAEVQQCIIHQIRRSLDYVSWKDRRAVIKDLKPVYKAATEEAGRMALEKFADAWENKYPKVVSSWRTNWENLATFFAYPECLRRVIYTTNAVEAIHRQMRKVTKNKSVFPSDQAVLKLLFLNMQIVERKWTMKLPNWPEVLNYLAISHKERFDLET